MALLTRGAKAPVRSDEFRARCRSSSDHAQILRCLTDDITWTVFGAFHLEGKTAYVPLHEDDVR